MLASRRENPQKVMLTKRELEILRLIVKEYTNQEIAGELFLSIYTIEFHRADMLEKLGVKKTRGW